jgi:hypothetical protein
MGIIYEIFQPNASFPVIASELSDGREGVESSISLSMYISILKLCNLTGSLSQTYFNLFKVSSVIESHFHNSSSSTLFLPSSQDWAHIGIPPRKDVGSVSATK